jgi:hypothetical protein
VNSEIMSESEGNGRGKGAERLRRKRHGGWSAAVRPSKSADLSLHPYAYTPTRLHDNTRDETIHHCHSFFLFLLTDAQISIAHFHFH